MINSPKVLLYSSIISASTLNNYFFLSYLSLRSVMAWKSHGKDNADMVKNLKGNY